MDRDDLRDAATLSSLAYTSDEEQLRQQLAELGWELWQFHSQLTTTFFGNAAGFIAVKNGVMAVVIRGSDGRKFQDIIDGALKQDFHYADLQPLLENAVRFSGFSQISEILVTGHSLGGAMAERFVALEGDRLNGKEITAITFGSPGVLGVANPDPQASNTLSIRHADDPVANWASNFIGGQFFGSRTTVEGSRTTVELPRPILESHSIVEYQMSATVIAYSSFFNEFISNPASYRVAYDGNNTTALYGSNQGDLLMGLSGDDLFSGAGGNDLLEGGRGNDIISGGDGSDRISGGADSDILKGDNGDDFIYGGLGDDKVKFDLVLSPENYLVSESGDHITVQALSGPEGTDQVYDTETFVFKGQPYSRERMLQLVNPTPTAPSTAYGDTPGGGTFATVNTDVLESTKSVAFMVPGSSVPFTSAIETPNDKDYVRVYLAQGVTYQFLVEGVAANGFGALADTFFRIRDGRDLSILNPPALFPTNLNNHDQVVGTNARIDFVAPYSGLYFVSVGAGGPSATTLIGGYRLTATIINAPPSVPQNQSPVAAIDNFKAVYGQTIGNNVLANDTDPNIGNVLGADAVNSQSTPLGGIVSILANGAFQYIAPANGLDATDSFSYTVRDGAGGSATGTVTIELKQPQPSAPIFTNQSNVVTIPNSDGPFYALDGHDVLTGSPGLDRLVFGGEGNDVFNAGGAGSLLIGGPGDDWFVAAQTADNFYGDELSSIISGSDTADFSGAVGSVTAVLAQGTASIGSETWTISGIENVIGGAFGDTLTGYINNDRLVGAGGNDVILGDSGIPGVGGSDDLYGGAGNDNIQGGPGDDNVFGGDDNDELRGGDGRDFLNGDAGRDLVQGDDGDDVLDGGDGDDGGEVDGLVRGLFGGLGNDRLFASQGNDRLRGNEGVDTVDYSRAPAGITGQFASGLGVFLTVAGWGSSTVEEIEVLVGSSFDDDFSASGPAEAVYLGAGNDHLTAFDVGLVSGDDGIDVILSFRVGKVFGGNGDDVLRSQAGDAVFFGDGGNDRLFGGIGFDYLEGNEGNDLLEGGDGEDYLLGGAGIDTLNGGDGSNDVLEGNQGNDTLDGGAGNDFAFYFFAPSGVVVDLVTNTATGGDGNDTLISIEAVGGSEFADTLRGNNSKNDLLGYGGSDNLDGGAGNDYLEGEAGDDTLNGGTGNDDMVGGLGNDVYVIDSAGDVVTELSGEGSDTIQSSITLSIASLINVENLLLLGSFNINGVGNTLANTITGNAGNNILDGGVEAVAALDILNGGAGNDTYVLRPGSDTVIDSAGIDTITSMITRSLASYASIEKLTLLGTAANGTGNGLANTITGNAAANILDGGLGIDTLVGLLGNDTYKVTTGDIVTEFANQGTADRAKASQSYILGASANIEFLETTNAALATTINLTGNGLINTITGNAGINNLSGLGGNDVLSALGGNDVLNGGTGNDRLTGGAGLDTFIFNTALSSTLNKDTITDFFAPQDTIKLENSGIFSGLGATLGTLSATKFWASNTGVAHDADDRIIYNNLTGVLTYDSNGSAAGGAVQFAVLTAHPAITNADFFVI